MAVTVWTKEQDEFLREHRPTMLATDLAKAINAKFGTSYSKGAICGRASRLNLPLDKAALMIATGLSWTPEQDAMLRQKKGTIPEKELVELLNWTFGAKFSRFAVVARAKRLGLPNRGRRKAPAVAAKPKAVIPAPQIVRREEALSHRKTILDLKAMECRWPDEDRNEDGHWTFCGCRTADASSYCPAHAELSKGQGTASERNAPGLLRRAAA